MQSNAENKSEKIQKLLKVTSEQQAQLDQDARQQQLLAQGQNFQQVSILNPGQQLMVQQVVAEQQVDWLQPDPSQFHDSLLKWFKDYASSATHDKMSNDDFAAFLQQAILLDHDSHLDDAFRKLAAMHKFPKKIINKDDVDLLKECGYFVRHIIKPAEQRTLLLGRLANKGELSFHRDHPDLKMFTERFAALCIHIHGKTEVEKFADKFATKLEMFCNEFTKNTASMPSKWSTPAFRDVNSLLRLACGCGDLCAKGCGKVHADLFTLDDCRFDQNKLNSTEKSDLAKHKEKCEQAKRDEIKAPATPVWKLTEVYKKEIIDQASSFVVKNSENDFTCLLCVDVESVQCKTELLNFGKTQDFPNCEAYLKKHSHIQVSLQVSLLYHGSELVRKQLKMNAGMLHGFYQTVSSSPPVGPVLPPKEDAPQAIRLYGSIQRKLLSFLFYDPSTYTCLTNNQLKQSFLGNSKIMEFACQSTHLNNDQEKAIRLELSGLTADNPTRRIKNLNE